MQKSIKNFSTMLGLHHVCLWTSLCCKKVVIMQSPLVAPSVLLKRWVYMPTNHALQCFIVCSNVCVEISQEDCRFCGSYSLDSVVTSSAKSWYSLTALQTYTCIRLNSRFFSLDFSMHKPMIPNKIEMVVWQLWACENSPTSLSRHFWISNKIIPPHPNLQSRNTSLGRRDSNKSVMILFRPFYQFVLFPARVRAFQLPSSCLWWAF